ncbi:MAG TPA: thiamine pyrophosphate-dependent enzyme [Verrucomicrobiae bacterium]|nr:thiamine pyrophosphate-dependent enzyme [Verrucomicrobiae bacterium]
MKRYECLKLLAPMVDEHMFAVTSLSTNTPFWFNVRPEGPNFFALNMGLCLPFALGLTAAFPKRKVISIDSDGSLMNDSSSLITVADVNPPNLVAFVFDNSSYAFMGSTFTARRTDLAKMAQGAGIAKSGTVRTLEEFSAAAKQAIESTGPHFIVAKVEPDAGRVAADRSRTSGRPMREWFMDAVRRHPDYQGRR